MAHDVDLSEKDVAIDLRSAIMDAVGQERFELWLGDQATWQWRGDSLRLVFSSSFAAQLAAQTLHEEVAQAARQWCGRDVQVDFVGGSSATHLSSKSPARRGPGTPTVKDPPGTQPDGKPAGTRETTGRRKSAGASPQVPLETDSTTSLHTREPDLGIPLSEGVENVGKANCRSGAEPSIKGTAAPRSGPTNPGGSGPCPTSQPPAEPAFIVSESNQLAWSTAKLAVTEPGKYSPVLFFGPSGCGKSLLATAMANQLRRTTGFRRVPLVTSEQFTNDFMSALRGRELPMFRDKYRNVDALVIEDIQFLLGKRSTLNEFRYTLDNLLRRGKQVVLTADRPLQDLQGMGKQLVSRIQGGLTAPLMPLDREARTKALRRQLQEAGVSLPDAVCEALAERATGDGRVLTGIAKRLIALHRLSPQELTWDQCWNAVSDLVQAVQPVVQIRDIERAVCSVFGLEPSSLKTKARTRRVSQPRMVAMFLARKYTPAAYKEIGQYFGSRRHSTVIAAERAVESWLQENARLESAGGLNIRDAIRHAEAQLQVG